MKWPRYAEMALGAWLIVSAWLLERPEGPAAPLAAGIMVLALAAYSVFRPHRYVYLGILAVALGLLAYAYLFATAQAQGTQSDVAAALLLLMFAILPTEATLPPRSWREYRGS